MKSSTDRTSVLKTLAQLNTSNAFCSSIEPSQPRRLLFSPLRFKWMFTVMLQLFLSASLSSSEISSMAFGPSLMSANRSAIPSTMTMSGRYDSMATPSIFFRSSAVMARTLNTKNWVSGKVPPTIFAMRFTMISLVVSRLCSVSYHITFSGSLRIRLRASTLGSSSLVVAAAISIDVTKVLPVLATPAKTDRSFLGKHGLPRNSIVYSFGWISDSDVILNLSRLIISSVILTSPVARLRSRSTFSNAFSFIMQTDF